jgi:hypothetical protein
MLNLDKILKYRTWLQRERMQTQLRPPIYVEVIWGDPGTGKSTYVQKRFFGRTYTKETDSLWWEDYEDQEVLVIEEFSGQIPPQRMNRLCDRYPCQLPVKNRHAYAKWTHVCILSNTPDSEWWKDAKDVATQKAADAFRDRISKRVCMQGQSYRSSAQGTATTAREDEECLVNTVAKSAVPINGKDLPQELLTIKELRQLGRIKPEDVGDLSENVKTQSAYEATLHYETHSTHRPLQSSVYVTPLTDVERGLLHDNQ